MLNLIIDKNWDKEVNAMAQRARAAATILARSEAAQRTHALKLAAKKLREEKDAIVTANAGDIQRAQSNLSKAMIDRLALDVKRVENIAKGLDAVAAQPDP